MGLFNEFLCKVFDTVEDVAGSCVEVIENQGRKIERRGNALFGCKEYDDASLTERAAGTLGLHDDGIFKKKKEKLNVGLEPGDIVCVSRGVYDHYGVYAGCQQVIHYTSGNSDIDGDMKIIETSFARFLREAANYNILVFPDCHGKPCKVGFPRSFAVGVDWKEWLDIAKINYKLYDADETVKRARSRLGEEKYSISFNNCEHFAIWCKTGISESHQINELLEILTLYPRPA